MGHLCLQYPWVCHSLRLLRLGNAQASGTLCYSASCWMTDCLEREPYGWGSVRKPSQPCGAFTGSDRKVGGAEMGFLEELLSSPHQTDQTPEQNLPDILDNLIFHSIELQRDKNERICPFSLTSLLALCPPA